MIDKGDYQYGDRHTSEMPARAFTIGQGKISSYLSIGLGSLSVLGVLCFLFPEYLTTPELRETYDVPLLLNLLHGAIVLSVTLGLIPFILQKRRRLGALGVSLGLLAIALGGFRVDGRPVERVVVFAGVDWFVLDLLGSAIIFIFIEKLFPKYEKQAILRPAWQLDLAYFAINHLLIGLFLLVGNNFAPAFFDWAVNAELQAFVRTFPTWLQVIALMVVADLAQYWSHRMFHEVKWLWKFHAVHHSAEHMDWLAGSRNHIVQVLVDRSLIMVPLYLIGTDKAALDYYVVIAAFQAVFVHANVRFDFGWLKYIVVTPQFHHWHHSKDKPAIDTNYAVHFTLWDFLFRSLHLPGKYWPKEYGTVSPLPKRIWTQFLYPFTRQ